VPFEAGGEPPKLLAPAADPGDGGGGEIEPLAGDVLALVAEAAPLLAKDATGGVSSRWAR